MNNIGLNIIKKENLLINIERLAAQRQIYSDAKFLFSIQILLSVFMPVLLIIGDFISEYFFSFKLDWIRAVYAGLIIVVDIFLINQYINNLKNKASSIQELFDCEVLDIEWNKILVGEKPSHEDVNKYSKKYFSKGNKPTDFQNWYEEPIKTVKESGAKTICQKTNYSYDVSLRRKFLTWIIITGILVFILLIVGTSIGARSFILSALIPFIPILSLISKLWVEHSIAIKNLESLNSSISSIWQKLLKDKHIDNSTATRQLQDKIYQNRKSSPLIPDFIYKRLRKGLEQQTRYLIEKLVEEYKKN